MYIVEKFNTERELVHGWKELCTHKWACLVYQHIAINSLIERGVVGYKSTREITFSRRLSSSDWK